MQQLDWLQEYNCSMAPVSFLSAYTAASVPSPASGGVYQLAEIEAELRRLLQLASPPIATTANTIYAVHLPPTAVVQNVFGLSCVAWLGHHNYFNWTQNGQPRVRRRRAARPDGRRVVCLTCLPGPQTAYYTIIPDYNVSCTGGEDMLYRVSSEELIETITDPLNIDPAWFDDFDGSEIVDLCGDFTTTIGNDTQSFVVAAGWSNCLQACTGGFQKCDNVTCPVTAMPTEAPTGTPTAAPTYSGTISCPADVLVRLQSGYTKVTGWPGAWVAPVAKDASGTDISDSVTCSRVSGSNFFPGSTVVTCASPFPGPPCSFKVTVPLAEYHFFAESLGTPSATATPAKIASDYVGTMDLYAVNGASIVYSQEIGSRTLRLRNLPTGSDPVPAVMQQAFSLAGTGPRQIVEKTLIVFAKVNVSVGANAGIFSIHSDASDAEYASLITNDEFLASPNQITCVWRCYRCCCCCCCLLRRAVVSRLT